MALDEIELNVKKGDFIAVLGANGSGKSTLARHINALLTHICRQCQSFEPVKDVVCKGMDKNPVGIDGFGTAAYYIRKKTLFLTPFYKKTHDFLAIKYRFE